VILGLRFGLDLYQPASSKLYAEHMCPLKNKLPRDIDIAVVRENTEGLYSQIGGIFKKGTPDEVATVTGIYTRKGVERAIRYAFDLARERAKTRNRPAHLTMVDKANAMRPQDIWTRTFAEVGREYPDVEQDHAYVDACAMWLVKNPESFDTVVVSNMFGDILTDLGAAVQGGMGIAASGNIHPGRVSMFEPIHGSAPKHAGKNVASPIGGILAMSMLLDYIGEKRAAQRIESAVAELLGNGTIRSVDARSGIGTHQAGTLVAEAVRKLEPVG
jgi:3-isopropylmalate dehydrogenase